MQTEDIIKKLEDIGLTNAEVKVYLALLELGDSTSGHIIDKSQTANSKIYIVLEKLITKGIVTYYQQSGLKYYKACKPSQILRYLQEKKEAVKKQEEQINTILPTLNMLYQEKQSDTEAIVFKGYKGLKTAFNELVDELNSNDEVNIMGVHNFGDKFKPVSIYFQKIRSEKKIKANFLINESAKEIADMFSKYPPSEIRFMKPGVTTPTIFLIYKDKVIINLGDDLIFIRITSKRVAESFNTYFKQFWKTAKKYSNKK